MAPALPFVDEHSTTVAASMDVVWQALLSVLERSFARPGAGTYARAVGCADTVASGPRPLAVGSTVPGFHVVRCVPSSELVLEGSHRFSTYRLAWNVEERAESSTQLRGETSATFPGLTGQSYRLLVVRSGAHAAAMRRLVSGIRRDAERRPEPAPPALPFPTK